MPDIACLLPLCELLKVNVNDLLSGEEVPPEHYSRKAEENMLHLLQENEQNKKKRVSSVLIGVLFLGCLLLFLVLTFANNGLTLSWFLDLPAFLLLAFASLACVSFAGAWEKKRIFTVLRRVILPIAACEFFISMIIIMGSLSDASKLGANLAVAILSLLYGCIGYVIFYLLGKRLI